MRIKRIIPLILTFSVLLISCGSPRSGSSQTTFHYLSATDGYYHENGIILDETRSIAIDSLDYAAIMELYLKGPVSSKFRNPFPDDLKLISFTVDQAAVNITLSENFASLNGIDLTLACACICLTVRDVTGYSITTISAQNSLLDDRESITMDANELKIADQ